jgi:polar amino acid transport system substrate-binding protein
MKRVLVLAIFALFASQSFLYAESLRIATLDWEPYTGHSLKSGGFCSEIVTEVFKKAGYTVTIDYISWDKAIEEGAKGNYDAVFPEYYSRERTKDFAYSNFFTNSLLGFYERKGASIKHKTLRDLAPYKIGVVKGYVNTEELDKATYLKKIESDSDEENLRKLARGEMDLIVIDKLVAQYLISTKMPAEVTRLVPVEPPLMIQPLFVIFPKKLPQSDKRLKDFNKALDEFTNDGGVSAIMKKSGVK